MISRRVDLFYSGERLIDLRPKLNRLADVQNANLTASIGLSGAAVSPSPIFVLEIKAFATFPGLTCVYPGLAADMDAVEYPVDTPPTFSEADRDGVDYTYTDLNERSADDGVTTETQYLWPSYRVGDLLHCAMVWQDTGSGVFVVLRDLNVDGRQWVASP